MPRRGSSCSADLVPLTPTGHRVKRSVLAALLVGTLLALPSTTVVPPAAAESPTLVAEEAALDGVFVARGRNDIDEESIATIVQQARARGLRLVVVAPLDPQPDPVAFARRVQEASDADAAIVFPVEGGFEAHVIDEFDAAHLRALAAARSKASSVDAVETFSDELLAEPSRELPPIVNQLLSIVVLLAIALAGAVALEQILKRVV
ncbi:MAG: hypothetical protein GY773_31125, partial [Actinomycetia bacterium]|nr:hypothetical protein [Actinomycetes bacterium]